MIQVLIVDGKAEVRGGLHMRLAAEPDMVVVDETGDAELAPGLAEVLNPDVIVADIEMKGGGVEMIQRLRAAAPLALILALTLNADEDTRDRAREAGAHALLEKYGGAADLVNTVRRLVEDRHRMAC